jgi:serine protease AprX
MPRGILENTGGNMRLMAAVFLATLTICSSVTAYNAPLALVQPKNDAAVQSSLISTIDHADNNGTIKAWVFFTDKGFSTFAEYNVKLAQTESVLTTRAKSRRLETRGENNLVDFYDIPVYQPYINQVVASGVKLRRVLKWFNAVTVEGDAAQLEQIAQLPFVLNFKPIVSRELPKDLIKYEEGNPNLPLEATSLDYGFSLPQLEQMNTTVAHELGFAGQDVLVCMMDVGYHLQHIAFQPAINDGRMIAQYDFINNDDNTDYDESQDTPTQANHGTLTWSTLGGQASGSLYGPAYLADFCLAKTEDVSSEHHSEEDNWAAGAEWADSLGARVISASLGYRYDMDYPDQDYPYEWMNGDSTIVAQAADLAASRGITVATAQGNDGYYGAGSLISPADADSVIACGAVMESDEITTFSAIGPTYDGRIKPEVCALGQGTACADPNNMNGFTWASGTSLSTPLVGGACGVLLSAHPNWTPMMVREALMMTATDPDNPDNDYGWGIINVGRALFYHPQGDIVIDHMPLIYFPSGLDNIVLEAEITGGAGIDPDAVYLYWRTDEQEPFQQVDMINAGGDSYHGIVGGLDDGYLQYYISASDIDGVNAVYPYGAPDHFFTVFIDSTEFFDSFENGLYYWDAQGTGGNWSLTAERSNTGNISVTDSPYRDYNNNAELTLTSKFAVPLYNSDSASVSFMSRHILQSNLDYVYFEVSTDGGQNWQLPGPVLTGTQLSFAETNVNLANYLGNNVMFRFRMVTDGSGVRDGVHIDDFHVVWDVQTGIDNDNPTIPRAFALDQNYPNPFNPSTAIKFDIPRRGDVELVVYDILGKKVKTLVSGILEAGSHQVIWDGTDESGDEAASGIYLYKISSDDYSEIKRMTLIR